MILSLSGRMFTIKGTEFEVTSEEFVKLAADIGYKGVEIRRGMIDDTSSDDDVRRMKGYLDKYGVQCAFITASQVAGAESLAQLKRIVDIAAALDCRYVRHEPRSEEQIPVLQEGCDYAKERGVNFIGQIHNGTLFEKIDMTIATLEKINRDNFGVAFEASHLVMGGEPGDERDWVKKLGHRIFTVSLQNYKRADNPTPEQQPFVRDGVSFIPVPLDDAEGVNVAREFDALKEIGFDGFATYMAGKLPGRDNKEVAREVLEFLSGLLQ